jgi:arsenate reductase
LDILDREGIEIEKVEYLKHPPTIEELQEIVNLLGIYARDLIRTQDDTFTQLGLSDEQERVEQEWLGIIHANPSLMERPVVVYNNKAVIARPPEKVLNIL